MLRRAVDLGVDHIDTAQYYGPDVATDVIHEALHPYPGDLVLVSKVGARRDDKGGWPPAQRPEELRSGVEANLRSLAVDTVDVVKLRRYDHSDVPLADQVHEMAALRDEGKIRGVGLSNVGVDDVRAALEITDIACVQNAYNVCQRDDQPVLDLCRARGIPYVPFFPLGSAFGQQVHVTDDPVVVRVAQRLGATPTQVGLAWLLAQWTQILVVPGTSNVAHLEENVAAGDVTLDEQALAELA